MIPSPTDHPPSPAFSRSSSPYRRLWLALLILFLLLVVANWVVNQLLRSDAATFGLIQELLLGLAGGVLLVIGGTVLIQAVVKKPRPLRTLGVGLYLLSIGGIWGFIACLPLLPAERVGIIGAVWILVSAVLGGLAIGFRRAQQPE